MLHILRRLLHLLGLHKPAEGPAEPAQQEMGLVPLASSDLMGLFARIHESTRRGKVHERKVALAELLLRHGDGLEITASPCDRTAIQIRPRQSRFSALLVVRLAELDEPMRRVAFARLLQRPQRDNPLPRAQVAVLPQARVI
jgi:hypothetical protein